MVSWIEYTCEVVSDGADGKITVGDIETRELDAAVAEFGGSVQVLEAVAAEREGFDCG